MTVIGQLSYRGKALASRNNHKCQRYEYVTLGHGCASLAMNQELQTRDSELTRFLAVRPKPVWRPLQALPESLDRCNPCRPPFADQCIVLSPAESLYS